MVEAVVECLNYVYVTDIRVTIFFINLAIKKVINITGLYKETTSSFLQVRVNFVVLLGTIV